MRKLAIFSAAFSLGIALAQYLIPIDVLLPLALACFFIALGVVWLPEKISKPGLLIFVGVSLAFGYNWMYIRQVQTPMKDLAGAQRTALMILQDYAVETDYGAKVTVKVNGLPGKVIYYGSKQLLDQEPGQCVLTDVFYENAARIRDDDITTFTSKGVFLLAYQRGEELFDGGNSEAIRWWPVRAGHRLQDGIETIFSADTAGFMTAILTGSKRSLSVDADAALSESGLYHILAVSGMHCGFLLALVVLITGRQRRKLTAVSVIVVLVFYALLTGSSPSVVRACVMLSMLVTAPIFRRESDPFTSLMAALLLILLQNPFAVASVSLQLSFAAVAGLLWLTPKLYHRLADGKKRSKVYIYFVSGFSATMGALVFSTPISALYFGSLPLVSPVSNLLCLWAAGIVFVLGLLAVLAGFLWYPMGLILAIIPEILVKYILFCAGVLAKLPYHSVYFLNPFLRYWLVFAYVLFAVAYFAKTKNSRKYVLFAVLAILALCVTVSMGKRQYQNDLDIVMLDVGQGQSVILSSGDTWMLVDCGSGNSWYDAGEIASHQLQTMGCRRLDGLLLTHYDRDHISGVAGLLARMDVETLFLPILPEDDEVCAVIMEMAVSRGVDVRLITEKERVRLGKAEVNIFPPADDVSSNEQGLAVLVSFDEQDFLLTGDMDAAGERQFMRAYDLPDIEILVAGHHGSKYSASADLLEKLKPETVCISVGNNSYGHPADATMRRLAEQGCAVYRTDLHGDIWISINEGEGYGTGEEKNW